ncbi:hypothetical protein AB3N62_09840 [Leptospira sp. WS4.C2]
MKLPVLLIAFNRPKLTSLVMDALEKYKPKILYVAIDGPRNETDSALSNQIKLEIGKRFEGIEVKTLFRTENLGCKLAVSGAIDWFFANEELGIILEDDCLPNLNFFQFMEEMLFKFRNDPNVGLISGNNFFFGNLEVPFSYYASNYFHIWGWGTWRRSWEGYQPSGISMEEIESVVNSKFNSTAERKFWINNIFNASIGKLDTWDLQWIYYNWRKKRISIMPTKNLVSNIGFGIEATHTKTEDSVLNKIKTEELKFPLVEPKTFDPDRVLDYYSRRLFFRISYLEKLEFYFLKKIRGFL